MCEDQTYTEVSEDSLSDETEPHPVREKNRYAFTFFYYYVLILDSYWQNAYIYCIIFSFLNT